MFERRAVLAKAVQDALLNFRLRNLDISGQFADNSAIRLCPRTRKGLILLVELTRIERATS